MRTSSCKAKGRRACQELREGLLAACPSLQPEDIVVTPSGVTGPDLYLSPAARRALPFVFECKNQESLNIWAALAQAEGHAKPGDVRDPVVAFKRNHTKMYVAMPLESFLRLVKDRK